METLVYSTLFTLSFGASLGYFVFLLHHTEMIRHYAEELGLDDLLEIEEYLKWNETRNDDYAYYPTYISEVKGGFWGHLFGCPYCLMTFFCYYIGALVAALTLNPLFLLIGTATPFISALCYGLITLIHKKLE